MIFLDHQATTPLDPLVLDAMLPWLQGAHNAHSSEHRLGRSAAQAVEEARGSVAALLGCDSREIIFTSGATEASNLILNGLIGRGDVLVTSAIEHASVLAPAQALATTGAVVRTVPVDEEGLVDLDALEAALKGASLVSVMFVNNEIGTIQPLAEIAAIARDHGVPLHSDVTQAAGRISFSVRDLGLSYASLSSHKIYGPQGVGAAFLRADASAPRPQAAGGGQERGFRPGTLPVAACVGLGAAARIALERCAEDHARADAMMRQMLSALAGLGGVQVNGSLDQRIPHNLNIALEGVDADVLLARLPALAVSTGSACSSGAVAVSHVLRAIGASDDVADSSIRIGFGRFTEAAEVEAAARMIIAGVTELRGI